MYKRFRIKVPGRVNLIGEHIDHQNFSVLPCAINRYINFEVVISDNNTEPALAIEHAELESLIFQEPQDIRMKPNTPHWSNYILASYLGVCEHVHSGGITQAFKATLRLPAEYFIDPPINSPIRKRYRIKVVSSDLPPAAGLSSSSALVCGAALAWNTGFPVKELAHVCALSEVYVATVGGGMDQAAILLSKAGCALRVSFNPLKTECVQLPHGISVVVSHSGVIAEKAVGAIKYYNKRVFELRCANYVVAKLHNGDKSELKLKSVLDSIPMSAEECTKHMDSDFKQEVYNKEDIKKLVDKETLQQIIRFVGEGVWSQNDTFALKKRLRHVLSEQKRVEQFAKGCETGCNPQFLGSLLMDSQKSLADDFECSCPEIDALVKACRVAGSIGSRITGAGWGGCVISLVQDDQVEEFKKRLVELYYDPLLKVEKKVLPVSNDLNMLLFSSSLVNGAEISEF